MSGLSASQVESASPAAEILVLQPGTILEREIHGGETKSFGLRLEAGTFLLLEISQRGVSLSSGLLNDAGDRVAAGEGSESLQSHLLAAIADRQGVFQLDVIAGKPVRPGRLTLRLLALRPVAPGDEARVRGAGALARARHLLSLNGEEPRRRAESLLAESLAAWQAAGEPRGEVETLLENAEYRSRQGDMAGALAWQHKAAGLAQEKGLAEWQARALEGMGFCNSQMARHEEAVNSYLQSLEIWKRVGGPYEQASALQGLSNAYQKKQDFDAALKVSEQALPLAEASGDLAQQARALSSLGACHYLQYRLGKAREVWEKALELSKQAGDVQTEASVEQNLAAVYQNQGQLQKALEQFTRVAARKSPRESGMTRYNMGNLYVELGNPGEALENYGLSREAFHTAGDVENEANALIGIGRALQSRGDPQAALAEYEKARRLVPNETWSMLHSIGMAQIALEKPREALSALERALEMARASKDLSKEAVTLFALGSAHARLGEPEPAEARLKEAVALGEEIGYQSVVAPALLTSALLRRGQGRFEEAQADVEKALGVIESTRRSLAGDELRTGFFAAKRTYYDLDIDLLLKLDRLQPGKGYRARALEASERARARGLLDLLAEGRIDVLQGLDPDLRQREDEISDQISRAHRELRSGKAKPEQSQSLRAELRELDKRRDQLDLEIQTRNKKYAEVRYPSPLKLDEIQRRVLDDKTALIEYVLGQERSVLFVITRQEISTFELPASGTIADRVRRLRNALERQSLLTRQAYLDLAFQLYRDLLEPASQALVGKSSLLIVPDGALYYIPFEALLTEGGDRPDRELPYLLRRYSIAYIPSASVLAGLREPRQDPLPEERKQVAAFAPFAKPGRETLAAGNLRVAASSPEGSFAPLPGSLREVSGIAALYPGAALSFIGDQADEHTILSDPAVAAARRLHFATHAEIDEIYPESSALVFAEQGGEYGLLQAREIFNLKLSADLAVLSACQTALGKEVTGEGLMGLTRAFFYAGIPSLVVSLWNVVDGPTPDLMLDFYKDLDQLKNKARALQSAKLSVIGHGTYSHPSYWAPFILLGEPGSGSLM
ncbi:MAG TPA: CHAT domain-containing protein [Thermoanaerobaculia bacterium]|jgi:CHAT domain-containing protein|nr:CHAT domain-containing protein [Thermoanaerobaculia bacterium]